ncbi:putative Ig domain-containing protein, partial [Microcoleus sp. herbarium8]|uniref:putative Ig domain-containing protein n=1 Tax=Microcoleus sp. herbarium8 TaxID=3055436 RepID=UPI002FD66ACE
LDTGATLAIPAFTNSASAVGSYTPLSPQTSAALDSTLVTPTGLLTDIAGNPATVTIPAGQSLKDSKVIVVDTIAPTVLLTTPTTTVTDKFTVTAAFTEASASVIGFDASDITVGNGTVSNFAGSGINYTFDVTPTNDGPVTIDVAASKATDAALNPNTAAPPLLVNANVPPKVTSISSTSTDGSYGTGKVIPITVTFTEPVVVDITGGTPTIALNSGGTATYASGTTTNTLIFNYTVAAGQTSADLDYSAIASLALNGGTINDATVTTSPAILTLPAPAAANSLGVNKNLVIDTTPPTVTINQASSQVDPTSNTLINYTVVFDQEVTGFDATDITFTGITGAAATVTGDGTGQNYNVAVTGLTQPGALTATIAANAANDLAGNGNTVSTSTDNSVTFNPVTPYVTAINKLDPDPTAATTVNYQVTFNEAVTGVDAADFTLVTNGVTGATIGAITGSGTAYNVPVNTGTLDGTVQLDLVDNNSILNALNAPLGGAALNDGNFKGQVYTVGKNSAPVVAVAINDQSATIDTGFTFTIPTGTFTDPNNDPLTYTATLEGGTPLPTWLTFDAATGIFSGTPATANIGNLKVNVAASDGQAFTTNTFLLTVSDKLNTPPVVAVALNDTSATINTAFSFTVPTTTFTDAENDPLTYTATLEDGTALPGWLTFDATTGVFSGTPAAANVGNLKVKLTANDGKASTGNTFILTVSDQLNTPPVVASATIDKSTTSGAVFSFTVPVGTFTDAENDPLTYTATQENGTALPTWLAFDAATQTFSGTPAAANVGNLKVKLTANDGKASTSDFFQLVVNAAPTPPQTPGQGSSPTPLPIPTP